ncbi:MAG: insulinase family protein [Alphaproteobacteria bacterium]|nr:MAG: insulinase family protein [Alphaproteobacteria bacterium]
MNLRTPLFALAAGLALAVQIHAQPPAAAEPWPQAKSDLQADPDVRFGQLPNGMRFAIRRNTTPPGQTSLRLRIDAGSLQEQDDQRGLAHFIEHMAFNGTTHVAEGEFVRRLERLGLRFGADTNASTEFTQTVYKLDLPESDAAKLDEGLFLLREVASEATFAPAAIDRERGIIQSEERTRASPAYRIFVDEIGYLLRGQRVPQRIPIGTPEVISQAQRDRFQAFYDAYYRPERATLIVVGDVDVDAMEARIRAKFGDWRGRGTAGRDSDLGTVAPRRTEARLMVEPGGTARVETSWVRPPDLRPDTSARRAEHLADSLALQILNRRLERIAANVSPAPYVGAQAARSEVEESAEITQISAVVQPGEWRPALNVIEAEQRRLLEHGVSQAELDREIVLFRTALNAQVAGASTRLSPALAEGLVSTVDIGNVFTTPAESLRLFEAAVPAMTVARVNQSARTIFAGEPVLYMTSPAPVEGADGALLAAYQAARAVPVAAGTTRQAQAWPYTSFGAPGRVAERRTMPGEIDATMVRFANGVRLTVKKTDFAANQVMVQVRFGEGQLAMPANRPSPAWGLYPGYQAGGLGRIDFEDMQEALNDHVYASQLSIDEDDYLLSGVTRPGDLAVQMQVLAAYMTDPAWRPTGWNRVRSLSGSIHDQLASTPSGVFSREAAVLLHNGDRRWATPTREQMAAMSIDDARTVLADALAHSPIEVVIVGDVDIEEAIRQTAATFGALPPRPDATPSVPAIRFPSPTPEPIRLTHRGRADQGLAYIAWPTQGFFDSPRQARTLNLLSSVFQLRLIQKIREEQGTTYSPQASHNASEAYPGYGVFSGRIEARPEALAGFLRDAESIAADLRDHPIGADEMERARRPLIDTISRQRTGNAWWVANLTRLQTDPRVPAMISSQLSDYGAMTPADLQAAARAFLVPGRAFKLIVVPEAGAAAAPAATPATTP